MFLRASRRRRSSGSNTGNRSNKATQHSSTSIAFIPKANADNSIVSKNNVNNVGGANTTLKKTSVMKVTNNNNNNNNSDTNLVVQNVNSYLPLPRDAEQSVDEFVKSAKHTDDLPNLTELSSKANEQVSALSPSPSPEICRVEERLNIIKRSRVSQTDSAQQEEARTMTTEYETQPMYSTYPVFSHQPQTSADELLVQTIVQECLDTLFFSSKTNLP